MNKKKKIVIIVASILASILVIVGITIACLFLFKERIAKAENNYKDDYQSYCTYEHAEEINIDGVLDEECWQNKKWFRNTYLSNTDSGMASFEMTSYVDDYGIYIAMVSQDTNLSSDGQRHNEKNTNFELYLVGKNVGAVLENDMVNTIQLNIDMQGDNNSYFTNVDRAVKLDGELNSGDTKGATLELFVPWETLGVDKTKGIPKEFYAMPAYYSVMAGQTTGTIMKPIWFPYKLVSDYYVFNAEGYTNEDKKGAVVGDSKFGHAKTANWDISEESERIIRSATGTENHKIYFTEHYGKNFIVETTIIPIKGLENNAPKAGINFVAPSGIYNTVFLDMREKYLTSGDNGTRNFETIRVSSLDNEDGWNMVNFDDLMYTNPNAASNEGVRLTVIKLGAQYWIFVDGKFIKTMDLYYMDNDVLPGLFALGGDVIFKDYSCTEIDEKKVTEYVNNKNLYMVEAKAKGAGGQVTTSEFSVVKGGSYDINLISKAGYRVSSVIINGKEMIEDVKKKSNGGTYTVINVKENQEVQVSFEKCDSVAFEGKVKIGEEFTTATVTIRGITYKELSYEVSAAAKKGFKAEVPAGKYQVCVEVENCPKLIDTVVISKDMSKDYTVKASVFTEKITVNEKELSSKMSAWDISDAHLNKVSTSYIKGGKSAPLYFAKTGVDFAVETTVSYTTVFKGSESEYQPDLMGGFTFHDGTNNAFLMAKKDGFVHTGYKNVYGFLDYKALVYPSKQSVKLGVVKVGEQVSVYLNERLATTMDWSTIAPKIKANSTVAIGLYMVADKTADIEFSNYSLQTGTAAAKKYIANHKSKDEAIAGSSLFAKSVTVGGKQLFSSVDFWNLSDIKNGVISGSFELESKGKPLYFIEHGATILAETTIDYTTNFKAGGDYQKDLMGGFYLTDGENKGWVVANQTGVTFTGWNKDRGLFDDKVLTYDGKTAPRSVKMTMAVQGKYIYIFFDDECIWKQRVSVVVPGVKEGADLAVGLYMVTDKTADIRFSNNSIVTNPNTVSNILKEKLSK